MLKYLYILPLFMFHQALQSSSLMHHAFKGNLARPVIRTFFNCAAKDPWQQEMEEYDAMESSLKSRSPTVAQKLKSLETSRGYEKYMRDDDYSSHYKLQLAAKSLVRFSREEDDQNLAARMISFYVQQGTSSEEEKKKTIKLIPEFQSYMYPKLPSFFKLIDSGSRQSDSVRFQTLHSFIKINQASDFRPIFKKLLDESYHNASEEFLTDYSSITSDLVLHAPFPQDNIDTISSLKAFITLNQKKHGYHKGFLDCIWTLLLLHAHDSQAKHALKKTAQDFPHHKESIANFLASHPLYFELAQEYAEMFEKGSYDDKKLALQIYEKIGDANVSAKHRIDRLRKNLLIY